MNSFESFIDFIQHVKIPSDYCRWSIYIIECNGSYKIGLTSDIKSRFSSIQTSNPSPIQLAHTIPIPISYDQGKVEKALHTIFKDAHIRGEWYSLTEQDIERIKAISIDVIIQIATKMKGFETNNGNNQLSLNL